MKNEINKNNTIVAMKFLLVLLLACQVVDEQDILVYGGDLGIKNHGSGDDATGMVIDGYAETGIAGQSGENAAGVVNGGDDGVNGFGGDDRGQFEGESGDEGGEGTGAIEGENGGSLTAAPKGGNTGEEAEGEDSNGLEKGDTGVDATDIVHGGKNGNEGVEGGDVTGAVGGPDCSAPSAEKSLGDDEARDHGTESEIAVESADGETGDPGDDAEGIAQAPGIDIGGNTAGEVKESDSVSRGDGGSTEESKINGDGGADDEIEFTFTKSGPKYGGHYFDGGFVHKYVHPDGKVEFGVLGGLLHENPLDYFGMQDMYDFAGYRFMENYTRQLTAPTGEKYTTRLRQTEEIRGITYNFMVRNFRDANVYELFEIVRHRIQMNHDLTMLIAYLESDEFTWHRFQLKREPSVEEFLKHYENLVEIPYRGIFYKNLRVLIRRLFSSCPTRNNVNKKFQDSAVNILMSNMALTEVATAMQTAIAKKSRLNDFKEIFDVLKLRTTIRKLKAIRASRIYNKMRDYLAEKVQDMETMENLLKVFFGFDLALIFSVYTIIF